MVEVFKTNVHDPKDAERVLSGLREINPGDKINFDLADCDKILRIESRQTVVPETVIRLVRQWGFQAEVLPDF